MSKVWLITGANSGFGLALTRGAVLAGDVVVAAARRPATLDALVASNPDQVEAIKLDVTDPVRIEEVVADVIARYGHIDVLVNNAGRTHVGAVEETSDEELRSLFDVHLFGPAALIRAVLPHMRERRSGAIVQMSSMGGQMSFAGFAAYSATKFALEGLSEALTAEVAPFGVRVLIVEPGSFRTGLFQAASDSSGNPHYSATVGATRQMIHRNDGQQPGDPAKAAQAIISVLAADDVPLRLLLGADAVDAVVGHLEAVRTDITAWEQLSRSTDLNDTAPMEEPVGRTS
ncbi:oxidoreductase [Paenarthrobacter nicotinovorans]|uniref:oxidoreductase n=1 Tax=Paenarthrobacter nicotinovorans TaxID=29320 RepID=UPI0011AA072F|nr:oxidoreductase [Paenarthrobacter nicotinovorans]